jgi:hypothetical protein
MMPISSARRPSEIVPRAEGYTRIMSYEQRLSNLGIDPELPEEEIKLRLAALSEKHAEEEAEALRALNATLSSSGPS